MIFCPILKFFLVVPFGNHGSAVRGKCVCSSQFSREGGRQANLKNEGWLVAEGDTGLTHEPFGLEFDGKVSLLLFGVFERGLRPFRFLGR